MIYPSLCHAGPLPVSVDCLLLTSETTDERLRDRDFPATDPADEARALALFILHYPRSGGALPLFAAMVPDGDAVLYWSTHRPSVREYCRQNPGAVLTYLGRLDGRDCAPATSAPVQP